MLEKIKNLFGRKSNVFNLLIAGIVLILAYKVIMNIEGVVGLLSRGLKFLGNLLLPFIIGSAIAYLLNPAVNFFERNLFGRFRIFNKTKTLFSLITVYILCTAALFIVLNSLIPILVKNITNLIEQIPVYINKLMEYRNGDWNHSVTGKALYDAIATVERELTGYISKIDVKTITPAISEIFKGIVNATGTVLDIVFGLIISIYLILDKGKLLRGTKRLLRALFKKETYEKTVAFFAESHRIFSKFIAGKSLDSLIIGILCFIGLSLLGVPNSVLYSVIVGVTNMIPYFGPFMGGIPVVLLVLLENPLQAVWVGLFIFGLQQFDGMILGPKILGDSINLRPFWIILAIIIGGGLFGVVGMFLGAPTLAVILNVVKRSVDKRLEEKNSEVVSDDNKEIVAE
ncbi:MAG: AI-2E family transporter [Clostridia bacterium]|nr:AI-2E family transporter [Clostridia bacterium]